MHATQLKRNDENTLIIPAPKQRLRFFAAGRKVNRADGRFLSRTAGKLRWKREGVA